MGTDACVRMNEAENMTVSEEHDIKKLLLQTEHILNN